MSLFGGVVEIPDIFTLLLVVFAVLMAGYALGRITIKGISLGNAGVFIVALLFGALFFAVGEGKSLLFTFSSTGYNFSSGLKIIQNLGLVLFVTSVGFIAGPKFFGNLKKNFTSYVLLGVVIILAGALAAIACIKMGDLIGYGPIADQDGFVAMIAGLFSGSLTSTPAYSAALETAGKDFESFVTAGYGISYIFGVIGVVLFIQLIPKLTKANMEAERAKLVVKADDEKKTYGGKLFHIDPMGIAAFSLAAVLGTFIGYIKIPLSDQGLSGTCFTLTATGGCLLAGLIFGHFGRFGRVNVMPTVGTLKLFRELGLVLFLAGSGISGGANFIVNFDPMFFVYGAIMTIAPLIIGFLFAKYVLKLSLLNNLGSITGGMTSTPALGTLISTAGTEDVAAAYAATYPIALILVVFVSQFLIILF